jgi:hypothetical protein
MKLKTQKNLYEIWEEETEIRNKCSYGKKTVYINALVIRDFAYIIIYKIILMDKIYIQEIKTAKIREDIK